MGSLVGNPASIYTWTSTFEDFVARYKSILYLYDRDPKRGCETFVRSKHWKNEDAFIGTTAIFLAEKHWAALELKLKEKEDEAEAAKNPVPKAVDESSNYSTIERAVDSNESPALAQEAFRYSESLDGSELSDDSASHYESEFGSDEKRMGDLESGKLPKSKLGTSVVNAYKPPPPRPMSLTRKIWLCCTWSTTWCIPPFVLYCFGMKDRDRQLAWREKFALCVIIFFMNAFVLFIIIGIGLLICPPNSDRSPGQVSSYTTTSNPGVYMYGSYYMIPQVVSKHVSTYMAQEYASTQYYTSYVLGQDVTYMFPVQKWASQVGCTLSVPSGFRLRPDAESGSQWYIHNANNWAGVRQYRKGAIVADKVYVELQVKANEASQYVVLNDRIYDLTPFFDPALNPNQQRTNFLGTFFSTNVTRSSLNQMEDITPIMNRLKNSDPATYQKVVGCLDGLFLVGGVDHRNDLVCVIPNYILLAFSIILVSVIGFKFVAALQFPGKRTPEDHDKFVICQVPCYTEGEASLHRTIDTLASLKYDDKHKLLFIVCDGMIIGSGNDRPTPRIVLDILGVDPMEDPESFSYQSLGDGNDQLNMGKVYSGLYHFNGHVVPYIVVVKVGKPSERKKPGNRYFRVL